MKSGTKWIVAIVGLLAGNVLAMTVLITAAHSGSGSHVLPSYYERAVHYDDAIDQAAKNRELGWQVDTVVHGGAVLVTARDQNGAPITGARVHVDGFERARDAQPIAKDLVADRAGEYRGTITHTGWVDLTVTIDRNSARYLQHLAVDAR